MSEDARSPELFPELPPPGRRWEVTFTLPAPKWGGSLRPQAPGVADVTAMYSADMAQAVARVTADDEDEAERLSRGLCSGLRWVALVEAAEVRPTAGEPLEVAIE